METSSETSSETSQVSKKRSGEEVFPIEMNSNVDLLNLSFVHISMQFTLRSNNNTPVSESSIPVFVGKLNQGVTASWKSVHWISRISVGYQRYNKRISIREN